MNLDLRVGCPAGFEKIHVAPYGDVTGCSMNPVSFGNVRQMPLSRIVEKMRRFHHFAKRHPSCIVALDREYIEDFMDYAVNFTSSPYPVEMNPNYGGPGCPRRSLSAASGPSAKEPTFCA